jgi:hypothetical protein
MSFYRGRKADSIRIVWRKKARSHDSGILICAPLGSVRSNFCATGARVGSWRNDTGVDRADLSAEIFFDSRRLRQYHQFDELMPSRLQ